jgi:large subunit ribosomal protein L1
MAKLSKRLQQAQGLTEEGKAYSVEEAIELVKKTATTKFTGSVEVHIKLAIDPKQTDQNVRGQVTLPHGTGKTVRVAAFVTDSKEKSAKEAGADVVGGDDLIQQIRTTGKTDFDIAVAEPAMMPKIAPIAKILGPRGLMPNPRTNTVTNEVDKVIKEIKAGRLDFKNDDSGNIHAVLGKTDLDSSKLIENFNAFIEAVRTAKPASIKKEYIKGMVLNATMGPGIRVILV